jgi:hypothetical protein
MKKVFHNEDVNSNAPRPLSVLRSNLSRCTSVASKLCIKSRLQSARRYDPAVQQMLCGPFKPSFGLSGRMALEVPLSISHVAQEGLPVSPALQLPSK